MTELKILKDLEEKDSEGSAIGIVEIPVLRQEAIRHAKFQNRPMPENLKIMPEKITIETKKIAEICNQYLVEWIKNFFNITEDDLK